MYQYNLPIKRKVGNGLSFQIFYSSSIITEPKYPVQSVPLKSVLIVTEWSTPRVMLVTIPMYFCTFLSGFSTFKKHNSSSLEISYLLKLILSLSGKIMYWSFVLFSIMRIDPSFGLFKWTTPKELIVFISWLGWKNSISNSNSNSSFLFASWMNSQRRSMVKVSCLNKLNWTSSILKGFCLLFWLDFLKVKNFV